MALQLLPQLGHGGRVDGIGALLCESIGVAGSSPAQGLRVFDSAHQLDQAFARGAVFGDLERQQGLGVAVVGER